MYAFSFQFEDEGDVRHFVSHVLTESSCLNINRASRVDIKEGVVHIEAPPSQVGNLNPTADGNIAFTAPISYHITTWRS